MAKKELLQKTRNKILKEIKHINKDKRYEVTVDKEQKNIRITCNKANIIGYTLMSVIDKSIFCSMYVETVNNKVTLRVNSYEEVA